jgi:G3E family GTPase
LEVPITQCQGSMSNEGFKKRIPVTVIGGFLGAGKTTLVNQLINSGSYKFGIIVNEFGQSGVDGSLIENVDSDGIAELSNGCLCCFGRDDLVEALIKLANREQPPEYVLVELSGVADPVPVAQTLLDPYIKSFFELDGIIGMADAKHLPATIQQTPEGAVQLAYASIVILNKLDLATAEQIETSKRIIKKLNPLARIIETSHSDIKTETILNTHAFEPSWQDDYQVHHTPGLISFSLRAQRDLSRQGFNTFVENFIVARPDQVFRAKGFLSIEGFEQLVLFQSVREIFSLTLSDKPKDGTSLLVIIGKHLLQTDYEVALGNIIMPSDSASAPNKKILTPKARAVLD